MGRGMRGDGKISGGMKINFIGNYGSKEAEPLFFLSLSLSSLFFLFSHCRVPSLLISVFISPTPPSYSSLTARAHRRTRLSSVAPAKQLKKKSLHTSFYLRELPLLSWRIIVLCSELQNAILFYAILFYSQPSTTALWAHQSNLKKTKASEIFLLPMLKLGTTRGPQSRWRQTAAHVLALALICETPVWS